MRFKSDSQRRAMFASMLGANNKFSHVAHQHGGYVVVERPQVVEQAPGVMLAPRKQSGLEILGQMGEKLADGVSGVWPGQSGEGQGDGIVGTNAISGMWPEQNIEQMLTGIVTATYPDSSEGRVADDRHYYVAGPRGVDI